MTSMRMAWAIGSAAVLAACLTPARAAEPASADELVAKNLAARGGADKLAAISNLRFKGKLRFPGDFELDYVETRARANGGVRVEAALQGLTLVQAYDGSIGWRINPFQGRRDAERMSPDEARSMADSGLVDGPLLAAKAAGGRLSYQGREDFDGTDAYKLKLIQADGDEFVYYLDPDTFLEIKVVETRRIRGAEQVTEYELGDYEKVGDVYYPFSIESWPRGASNQRQATIIESAEANPTVTAALFAMPGGTTPPAAASTSGAADAARDAAPSPVKEPPEPEPDPSSDKPKQPNK